MALSPSPTTIYYSVATRPRCRLCTVTSTRGCKEYVSACNTILHRCSTTRNLIGNISIGRYKRCTDESFIGPENSDWFHTTDTETGAR